MTSEDQEAVRRLRRENGLCEECVFPDSIHAWTCSRHPVNLRIKSLEDALTEIRELKPDHTSPEGYVRSIRKIAGMAIERITEQDIAETEPE